MRKLAVLFPLILMGQTTPPPAGTVDVATNITASSGSLVCVGTVASSTLTSTMHLKCSDGPTLLHESDYTITALGTTTYSLTRGPNAITWGLTKGTSIPDQWQVVANGTMKAGNF